MKHRTPVRVQVYAVDVLSFDADVLALKYAQKLYGVDLAVHEQLASRIVLPRPGGFAIQETDKRIAARYVSFTGVQPLRTFSYEQIRAFARETLTYLADRLPEARHVALTVHGPGYGLDEAEAFEAELAGIVDAISAGKCPDSLELISIVELNHGRSKRLSMSLRKLLPNGAIPTLGIQHDGPRNHWSAGSLKSAGYSSAAKPHVFVAMPFATEMHDIFHYGI